MTIEEIQKKIDEERHIKSRYPLRVIFCEDFTEYQNLITQLTTSCDKTICIGDFCATDDVHPRFRKIERLIEKDPGNQILLLSVGEYLRIAVKRECEVTENAQFEPFWSKQYSVDSNTRVYLPMFLCKELFNRIIGEVNERQKIFLWELDGNKSSASYRILVYSDRFTNINNMDAVDGLKNWFYEWADKLSDGEATLITSQYKDCEESFGRLSVVVVENPYDYLCKEHPEVSIISEGALNADTWATLYNDLQNFDSIEEAVLNSVNLQQFDSSVIATRWDSLNSLSRSYVWIWYQLNTPTDYVGTIIHKLLPTELDNLGNHIANDILLYVDSKPDWVKERRAIMIGMKNAAPSSQFFGELDKYVPKQVFELLTGTSQEERVYIIKTVCRWLRTGGDISNSYTEIIESVKYVYPELSWYMETPEDIYGSYSNYFAWYKKKKLINRSVDQPIKHPDYEALDSRYSVMKKYQGKDSQSFWIDGMGIEWLSLALTILNKIKGNSFEISTNIVAARIPTETDFNHQWTDVDEKRDRLDKLSHRGMPDDIDYFSCISNQIRIIEELMYEAVSYLDDHENVIITGDHGSSRLAALAFHEKTYTFLPDGATAMAFGRFCKLSSGELPEDILENMELCTFDKDTYIVMKDYNHFKQTGNAAGGNNDENAIAGELHGGLTPEESIVPLIVLHRKNKPVQIKIESIDKLIKTKGGKGKITVIFSRDVHSLDVETPSGVCAEIHTEDSKKWTLYFESITGDELSLQFTVNGRLMREKKKIKVRTPLGSGMKGGLLP